MTSTDSGYPYPPHPDVYRFFREDAIAGARAIRPELTEEEALRMVAIALRYRRSTYDLYSYADFNGLQATLREEAGE